MKTVLFAALIMITTNPFTIVEFTTKSDLKNWTVVDDVVMGGKSAGTFELNKEGFGVFSGTVSLKKNGGFSSVRYKMEGKSTESKTKIILRIKGDKKNYQFRIKSSSGDYYSYIFNFSTSGKWENIEIPLAEMYPSFRGRKLNMPNFSSDHIEEIAFLIGNKKEENFKLILDKIELH